MTAELILRKCCKGEADSCQSSIVQPALNIEIDYFAVAFELNQNKNVIYNMHYNMKEPKSHNAMIIAERAF